MNKTRMELGAMALAVLAAFGAWATPVDEATARTAAERFLQTSKMAARTLPERTVVTIAARGNLWVVRLAPSGHILLSGSDRATPIIGFSQNDFSEGEEDSAERAMLDAADAAVAAAEVDETKGRHSRWDKLLAEPETSTGKKVRKLLGTGTGTDINIEPFVDSKYNQNQPWNDLTPVTSKDSDYIWRGRSCAGCVSIADAAIYRELEWPKYPARIETVTHNLRGEKFAIRFNGSVPFDWSKMSDTYGYSGDMRGKAGAEEDKRYEIGRYVLWLNQSASMSYNEGESTSTKSTSAHGCERDWYTIGQSMSASDEAVEEKVTGILEAGIPVFVGIGGHAVVADGWQKDSTTGSQVHLVYGYGGNASDKFYSLETGPAQYFWVDHYPRAKPQLDPIPRVVGNSVTLSWRFPDCYTNSLTGFVIKKKLRTSASLTDWTADFSADSTGMVSPAGVWGTYDFGEGSLALDAGDLTYGMYQFSTPLTVTASSVLSLKMRGGANTSGDANKHNIVIEICGEDGNWKELLVPECTWANWPGSWTESTKSLAEYAGQTVQLRIYKRHITYNGRVNIGDFKVTNVIPLEGDDDEQEVAATARSATLTGLTAGADYAFSVVPKFDDDQVEVAGYSVIPEASDEKIATIAGSHQVPGSSGEVTEDYTTKTAEETSIEFTDSFRITEASQLSFGWTADCVADGSVTLYVYFTPTGGERESIYNITKNYFEIAGMVVLDGSGEYAENVSLESYAGQSGLLEVVIVDAYSNVASSSSVSSALQVTNVTSIGVPESETLTALEMPTFTSIRYAANGGAAADLVDGYLADGAIGSSTLYVTTPANVTSLTATPSHVELVKDENVHVEETSAGNWEITFDPVIPANRDRQRMILTLNATDTNGTTVHRDVVMRMTEDKIVVGEGKTWTLNDDYELTRSLVLAGGTVTANGTLAINQNGISSFTVVSNSTINGTGSLCISNSNATITFENSKSLTNSLDIESDNEETLTLAGTGTFVQGAGTTIKVYDMSLGSGVLLNLNLTSDQSTDEAIVQFGDSMAAIADWKLRIDAPTDMPKGTYPLIYASTYLSKPTTIYLPNLDRECSVEVKNSNTLNFVVGDPKTTQVTNTDYPVPYSWFTDMGVPASYIDTLKNSQTSSGYKWWQCYVLGLNPMGSGTFTATLTMNGTTPVVTYSPTNETLVADATMPITYVLQGNVSAEGGEWVDTSFDNPGSSYVRFRVDVRWTNDEEVKHIYSNEVDKPAATPVAQIGDTTYTSLAAAVGDAADGATVTLVNNTETTDAVTLNDKTITFMENGFAFNGTLTGNGTISVGTAPSTTTWAASKFVANGWTGTFVVGWNFSGKMMPDKFGIAGSTVEFTQAITSGYFNQDITGLAAPSIAPALFFDQDVTLSDGFANESSITTFAQVGMASGKTFMTRGRNNGNETYYKFTVVTNFNGTLNIRGKDHVRIGMVSTVGEHVANQAILTITKTANGDSAPAVGRVETESGADATTNAITTSGDGKAVFATINNVSGLYYAVAKIGDSYYATYAAAVEAYTDGDTIEVLDATAGNVPQGWEITSEGTRLTKIQVTITWNIDGDTTDEMYDYGVTPTHADPVKAADAQYTYTFTGWTPDIVPATEAATYTATYSSTVNQYNVTVPDVANATFAVTADGADVTTQGVAGEGGTVYTFDYGTSVVVTYTAGEGYFFDGNDSKDINLGAITTDRVVTAEDTGTTTQAVAKLVNGEAVSYYTTVEAAIIPDLLLAAIYGQNPNPDAYVEVLDPTAATPNVYGGYGIGYTSLRYAKAVATIVDAGYLTVQTALNEAASGSSVVLKADSTEVLTLANGKTVSIYAGTTPYAYNAPVADGNYTIDTEQTLDVHGDPIQGATTYTAREWYTWTVTVVTENATVAGVEDGAEVSEANPTITFTVTPDQYYSVSTVTANDTALTPENDTYTYMLEGDVTISATATVNEYTITWKNDDDSTIATTVVAYGVTPEYSGETPTKADDAQYTYTFTGWTPAIEAVASNTTYTATYSATPIEVIPSLPENPGTKDVEAAIEQAGFTDARVATIITGAENQVQEYDSFKTWAEDVIGDAAAVVASAHAADSYLLGTATLLQNDPVVTINAFNTGATAGAMTLSVTVTDGGTPVGVTPQKVIALIKATKDLSDWDGEGKLTPTLDVSGDKITVLSGSEPTMFLKLEK